MKNSGRHSGVKVWQISLRVVGMSTVLNRDNISLDPTCYVIWVLKEGYPSPMKRVTSTD